MELKLSPAQTGNEIWKMFTNTQFAHVTFIIYINRTNLFHMVDYTTIFSDRVNEDILLLQYCFCPKMKLLKLV